MQVLPTTLIYRFNLDLSVHLWMAVIAAYCTLWVYQVPTCDQESPRFGTILDGLRFRIQQAAQKFMGRNIPLHIYTDSLSLFQSLTTLKTTSEKRLLIDLSTESITRLLQQHTKGNTKLIHTAQPRRNDDLTNIMIREVHREFGSKSRV